MSPIGSRLANTRIYILDRHRAAGAGWSGGRDLHRRRGCGARIPEPTAADGGALCGRSVQCGVGSRGCTRTGDVGALAVRRAPSSLSDATMRR